MALDFQVRDVMHDVAAKFVRAYLPDAKKLYNLRAEFQPELDVHGIASKADVYNIETDPKVIAEGLNAGIELIYYLVADGYKVHTPLFNLRLRLPGEYSGDETRLADDAYPEARLQTAAAFRRYLRRGVKVAIAGIADDGGHIGEATDEATGDVDETATIGDLLTIRGHGLKIKSDAAHAAEVGVYFTAGGARIKVKSIAVNHPKTLKVVVPPLTAGTSYTLEVVTQSSVTANRLLQDPRVIDADFLLRAIDPLTYPTTPSV
jgi:hypothetical protein